MTGLWVVLGASVGAPTRYLVEREFRRRLGTGFPWGTLTVNVVASGLLGALIGASVSPMVRALFGTGLCGALSTYSAFAWETMMLADRHGRRRATAYAGLSLVAGGLAAALGYAVA